MTTEHIRNVDRISCVPNTFREIKSGIIWTARRPFPKKLAPFILTGTALASLLTSSAPLPILDLLPDCSENLTSNLSQSGLGVFFLEATDEGRDIALSGPRIIKVINLEMDPEMVQLVRDYKRAFPDGQIIMRVFDKSHIKYDTDDDPEGSANDYWDRILSPAISNISQDDKRLVTYLSGPNGNENVPGYSSRHDTAWTSKFYARLAVIISNNGFRPALGEISQGNLEPEYMEEMLPMLQALSDTNGVWTYQAFSVDYSTEHRKERWHSLRYKLFYDYLRKNHPELANLPMVLSEGGIDWKGNGPTDGWRTRGDETKFMEWLKWFDKQIRDEREPIVGVTIFQSGDKKRWSSFDIDEVSPNLKRYLLSQSCNPVTRLEKR